MITLTESAAEKVRASLALREQGLGIRIGVKTTGCSGMAYTMEYVDVAPAPQDQHVYEQQGFKIWIDSKSMVYFEGLVMDWVKKGLNEGFDFVNSKEKDRCGCGESFRV